MDPAVRLVLAFFVFASSAAFAGGAGSGLLGVQATVEISCSLRASVPKVGSEERARNGGTASFSVTCTRQARVVADPGPAQGHADMADPVRDPLRPLSQRELYELRDATILDNAQARLGPLTSVSVIRGISVRDKADERLLLADYSRALVADVMF